MRNNVWLAIPLFVMTACATVPPDDTARQRSNPPNRPMPGGPARTENESFLPPQSWWRDPQLAEPVGLSSEQFERLDKLQTETGVEVWRASDAVAAASRTFREALSAREANADAIRDAAARLRDARSTQFDRQVAMLVSEREILTSDQWTRLQATLEAERSSQRRERQGQRGGQGGMGGGRRGGGRGGRYP